MTPLSVLLVEDDRIDQMAFQRFVEAEQLGYDYTIAASLTDARNLLHDHAFDIIIADYSLGDGTALDMLPLQQDTPLIIVTGMGSEAVAVKAMKAGAYDYLTKDSTLTYLSLLPIVVQNAVRRARAEREARQMFGERIRREMLENFIRDASHDLRTPLTTIGTSLYLLEKYTEQVIALALDPLPEQGRLRDLASKIERQAQLLSKHKSHLEQIITDMLEMVRIDNLDSLERVSLDLNRVIEQIIESQEERIQQKAQRLAYHPHPEPLRIAASPDELTLALRHILRNAIDYTPDGGEITVMTAPTVQTTEAPSTRRSVTVTITDTGIGISSEHLPHIFERFYKVNAARTMTNSGSGLGLSIARQLVELHGGRIEVESVVDAGSTFRVILPAE